MQSIRTEDHTSLASGRFAGNSQNESNHPTAAAGPGTPAAGAAAANTPSADGRGNKVRAMLRARLGEDIYDSWFKALEFDDFDGKTVKVSVPVKFLKNWIQSHYSEDLLNCCRAEFKGAERVDVVLRQPNSSQNRAPAQGDQAAPVELTDLRSPPGLSEQTPRGVQMRAQVPPQARTGIGGFEGSPLDPRYTFESFVVGASNRMAHAGATCVAPA